jgi:hypothetical protein
MPQNIQEDTMPRISKLLTCFLLCSFTLIAACATPAPQAPQEISFSQYPVMNVDVGNIEVIEAYNPPLAPPNIEHLMPYSPAAAMKIWVKDRLRATGSDKLMQVTIVDASVTESKLPKTKGIQGLFTNDQDRRYDGRLEVEVRIYGNAALSEADTSVTVTRSITIPENASVNSRRAAYMQMVKDMMEMMNAKLEKNMLGYMGNYISFAGN